MNIKTLYLSIGCALLTLPLTLGAQQKPKFHKFDSSEGTVAMGLSASGRYAIVSPTSYSADGARQYVYDMLTGEKAYYSGGISDISADGSIFAGSYGGKPAVYRKATGQWTQLPVPSDCSGASISKMTPDGHYAIGSADFTAPGKNYLYPERGLLWDLEAEEVIELTNLPVLDMTHEDQGQQRFTDISDDGRYVLGSMSFSFIWPPSLCSYLYDVEEQTCEFIGFDPRETEDWKPVIPGLSFVDGACISPNGKWVAASAYYDKYLIDSVSNTTQYYCTLLWNRETGDYTLLNDNNDDQDKVPNYVDNEGHVYTSYPSSNPYRDFSVRVGTVWYPFSTITKQAWGVDFFNATSYTNTGTLTGLSADARTLVAAPGFVTGESYGVILPDSLPYAASNVNLLGNYTASPASGSRLTRVNEIEITFEYAIKPTSEAKTTAKLINAAGETVKSSAAFRVSSKSNKMLAITFRPTVLDEGQPYTLVIPAGSLSLASDASKQNREIRLTYIGRGTAPVKLLNVYPADGSEIAKVDNSSNPVYLSYNAPVQVTDTASAQLIREADGVRIAKLNVAAQDSMVALYPTSTQYLYAGQTYRVELAAGSIADLSGAGASDALTLRYTGTYVRQVTSKSDSVFFDDFTNMSQSLSTWMRYEGDHLTPTSTMKAWGFDADNQPWNFSVRESSTSSDRCAASHSMYNPSGRSDDWMVIPQLAVTDRDYTLSFAAQSYKKTKRDTLRVVVWASEENINDLSADIIARMKSEGQTLICERLTPGLTEEDLAGDWQHFSVSLADYAGKSVYIGFWNCNENQSAIFVDSVLVRHKVKYALALTNDESVVGKESIAIKGRLTVKAQDNIYNNVELTLLDAQGNTIDTYSQSEAALKKDDHLDFAFAKELPLTQGEENAFSIRVSLDGLTDVVKSSVKNLAFQTTKRVVLEEFTGTTCSNCPQGIIAIDWLNRTYGQQFIPVSIHTYSGDPYASGLGGYSSFLGLNAAPSGIVNRSGEIIYPMRVNPVTADYELSNGYTLWADHVKAELDVPADLELSATGAQESDGRFNVELTVRSAINAKNQSLNLFAVIVEDGIVAEQDNNLYATTDTLLGEWGKGGRYAYSTAQDVTHDAVARAAYGASYNGTSGLLPQTLAAGNDYTTEFEAAMPDNLINRDKARLVVMLIDGNTDRVVNAVTTSIAPDPTAIEAAKADVEGLRLILSEGRLTVAAEGLTAAHLYSSDGKLIASQRAEGSATLTTAGYKGIALVKAVTAKGQTVRKVRM